MGPVVVEVAGESGSRKVMCDIAAYHEITISIGKYLLEIYE